MALTVLIKPRATLQVFRAAAWWKENRPAAPDAVDEELNAALRRLVAQPGLGTIVPKAKQPGTRRLYLSRTRYFVYYRQRESLLEVVAFWHASRESPPSA